MTEIEKEIRVQTDCSGIDWVQVRELLKSVEMGHHEPEMHQKAFTNSFAVIFLLQNDRLLGMGRAVSDGVYQAGLYDIAVLPEFQGRGFGRLILEKLMKRLDGMNVILYANPGRSGFYEKFQFRTLRTGMIRFTNPERMAALGFIE